ncbi:MAG: phosphatidate cytidylyltransferase [Proteobacteria bacterium]|nr:phosphatidate cytidylyltransferase [Pseudomonadota bacterium]
MTRNLSLRILTGVPLAVLAIWYFYFAPEKVFVLISIVLAIAGTWEFSRAVAKKRIPIRSPISYLSVLLSFLSFWFFWKGPPEYGAIPLGITAFLILFFSFFRQAGGNRLIVWYSLPLVWIAGPIMMLIVLRFAFDGSTGSDLILFVILVAAFNDIFAYFGGKNFGKHPLAPTISPKKTIEGSIFGLGGALLAGFAMASFYLPDVLSGWRLMLIVIIITLASIIGDLMESKFKRYCQIKDSSNLIPGHGGLLDRIDSYLFALPVFIGMIYALGIPTN